MLELLLLGEIQREMYPGEFAACIGGLKRRYPQTGLLSVNANGLLRESSRIEALVRETYEGGADVVTLGDQAVARTGARRALDRWPRLVRPLNLPPGAPGRGAVAIPTPVGPVWFVSLFTGTERFPVDDPFEALETLARGEGNGAPLVVDVSGPDPAVKQAIAWRAAERLPCIHVLGTGLGVATDDLTVRDGRVTVTDLGRVGGEDLIEGLPPQEWWNLHRLRSREPVASPAAPLRVDGLRIIVGPDFRAQHAERVRLRHPEAVAAC